jgi:TusA-related sulfurtransferase
MGTEEKLQILKMLEDKKISVEQAEKLLKAVDSVDSKSEVKKSVAVAVSDGKVEGSGKLKGKFKVVVESADGDNVVITLPLMLAKLAVNMMPKNKMAEIKGEGIDLEQIVANIDSFVDMVDEDIVNVESANGDVVRIYIEK